MQEMLLTTSSQGKHWIAMPLKDAKQSDNDDLIKIPYHGCLEIGEKRALRWWEIIIKGERLEPPAKEMRLGHQQTLRPGSKNGTTVTTIEIKELEGDGLF